SHGPVRERGTAAQGAGPRAYGGLPLPADDARPRPSRRGARAERVERLDRLGRLGHPGRPGRPGRPGHAGRGEHEGNGLMRLRVLLEPPHGATYQQILALATAAEEGGFDAFFRSDHYLGIDANDTTYQPTDSWTTLAGLAVQTSRVRLGTLVNAS